MIRLLLRRPAGVRPTRHNRRRALPHLRLAGRPGDSAPPAAEPWAYETADSPSARDLRARLIDVAIERLESAPHVSGMFWWKWMPGVANDPGGENFSMRDLEASVLLRRWASTPRVTAP